MPSSNHNYTEEQLQAIQEILQSLLVYEGGKMQSMNEMFSCSGQNNRIISKASEFGISLDLEGTGITGR